VLYVDTGCLLKLYYPEWNSAQVAAAVAGEELCFCALHELEITTALQLKIFRGEATNEQVTAALVAVEEDVAAGKQWCASIATGPALSARRRNSPSLIPLALVAVRWTPFIAPWRCC